MNWFGFGLGAQYRADSQRLLTTVRTVTTPRRLREEDLDGLPPLVATYVRRSGAIGQPVVQSLRATFAGHMRSSHDAPWMRASVEQVNTFSPMGRLFFMTAARAGVPFVVFHNFEGKHARMRVRLAGLVPIIDASGSKMTQSETVTLLNDMCILSPGTLAITPIQWQPIDASHVRAAFTNGEHTVCAVLEFSTSGDLVSFRSDDRYQSNGREHHLLPWITPLTAYRTFGKSRLASLGEAQWLERGAPWSYAKFELQHITYNESL